MPTPPVDPALANTVVSRAIPALPEITEAARQTPGLQMLLLFGSRARGDLYEGSDWDLGYLAGDGLDPGAFLDRLMLLLGTDEIDLVDLARASGLLRYRAAAEGRPLYQAEPGTFDRFWFAAVSFWCDMQPVLEAGYQELLDRLPSRP